jgi:hypothetical protein
VLLIRGLRLWSRPEEGYPRALRRPLEWFGFHAAPFKPKLTPQILQHFRFGSGSADDPYTYVGDSEDRPTSASNASVPHLNTRRVILSPESQPPLFLPEDLGASAGVTDIPAVSPRSSTPASADGGFAPPSTSTPSPTLPALHTLQLTAPLDLPLFIEAESWHWPERIRAKPDDALLLRWVQDFGAGATVHNYPRGSLVPHEVLLVGDNVAVIAETLLANVAYWVSKDEGLDVQRPGLLPGMRTAQFASLKTLLLPMRMYHVFVHHIFHILLNSFLFHSHSEIKNRTAMGNGVERAVLNEAVRILLRNDNYWRGEDGFRHPAPVPFVEPPARPQLVLTGAVFAIYFLTFGLAPPGLSPFVFYLLCASAMIPEGERVDVRNVDFSLELIAEFDEDSAEFLAPLLSMKVTDSVRAESGTRLANILATIGVQVCKKKFILLTTIDF